uniref:Uncharacterized protein n=1 Tax=Coptotermes formosanus TaxID=36987 RepID=R4UNS4_COPFO|nr:hypothetical protein [Coptotermes formosanus]
MSTAVTECQPYSLSQDEAWLVSTNSETNTVVQKPYPSSAPRKLTWIITTSIEICTGYLSTNICILASLRYLRHPTRSFFLKRSV